MWGGEATPSAGQPRLTLQNPPAALGHRDWAGVIGRLPGQQGRSPSHPASQPALHQVQRKLSRQDTVPADQELQWRRETAIQGSHRKPFSES